ncbi:hypothetical protein [Telmatospirillum sp. J64-1]|uniref:hypothetical protein n=1 Tax=Telmatospirillum sp. J64-1 TaxID=2502183 RepID=UPI00115E4D67|nr:hypothetical protein [Telmatospirillum sp. J64-1]
MTHQHKIRNITHLHLKTTEIDRHMQMMNRLKELLVAEGLLSEKAGPLETRKAVIRWMDMLADAQREGRARRSA